MGNTVQEIDTMRINTCTICDKTFESKKRPAKFCSEKCHNAYKYAKIKEMKKELEALRENHG